MSTCKWKKSLPIQVSENMTFVDQRGVTWKDVAELTLLKMHQPSNLEIRQKIVAGDMMN